MSGNLSHSMRENYSTHGVADYYKLVNESYRNPHFPGLKKVLARFLDRYVEHEKPKRIRVLDLAAGSGEATIAINDWYNTRWPSAPLSSSSPPPHAPTPSSAPALSSSAAAPPPPSLRIRQPFIPPSLRAAVTRPTPSSGLPPPPKPLLSIVASDPFTAAAYKQRTGGECLELGWAEVTKGELPPSPPGCSVGTRTGGDGEEEEKEEEEKEEEDDGLYDIVVVSFALHLVETTSELWALLSELSKRARWLVVTAPHKKPDIKPTWSFRRWDPSSSHWGPANEHDRRALAVEGEKGIETGDGWEIVLERTRLRVWRSEVWWEGE